MKNIKIAHLYPKEMNIYGDNGNILVLKKRLEWRGLRVDQINIGVGDSVPKEVDIIFGGGGQDAGQSVIADDLQNKSNDLKKHAEKGVVMLMICGMYQMMGNYFKTQDNQVIKGIGLLDIHTIAKQGRLIGNVITKSKWGDLLGYENHSGRTYLGKNVTSMGKAKKGQGNNGEDNTEGAIYNNVFGSYLHGPILAKSPKFADYLLALTLINKDMQTNLEKLDDSLEILAARVATTRPR
jgi:CobQ-like glutamine amidotransferase family enzyme